MSKTYYEILGVPRAASDREIKMAYHKLARRLHPDKADPGIDVAAMEAEFSLVSRAYNVLKDREKRAAYDQSMELQRQQDMGRSGTAMPSTSPAESGGAKAGGSSGGSDKGRQSVARRAFLKGNQLLATGDYARAAEFYEVAVKNDEDQPAYFAKLAQTLLRGHRSFSRAIEVAERAIALDPYNPQYRIVLAELYESAGSMTMAQRTYEEILKWDPTNERALGALAVIRPQKLSFLKRLFGKK